MNTGTRAIAPAGDDALRRKVTLSLFPSGARMRMQCPGDPLALTPLGEADRVSDWRAVTLIRKFEMRA